MKKNRKQGHANTAIVAMIAIAIMLVFTIQGTTTGNGMTGFAINPKLIKTGDKCFDAMKLAGYADSYGTKIIGEYCTCMKGPGERNECKQMLEDDRVGKKIEQYQPLKTCFDRMKIAGYVQKHGSTRVNAYCDCMNTLNNKWICEENLVKANEFYPILESYKKN
ncbi:hypothetical protein HYY69_03110 [Candidatus Woesearchaeota archaeon]|nr:hypothetical protein [Candidatus Woesearchaeota archaeon]